MNISQNGIDLIKKFEGCSLRAYKPVRTETHFTIGYGHYSASIKEGDTITVAKAEELLKADLKKFEDGVMKLLKVPVNQNQFDALVSFSFNLGLGNLQSSTLLDLINAKAFDKAANEFEKWVKAGGVVLAGLVKRRKAERELFVRPVASKPQKHYYLKTGSFSSKAEVLKIAEELDKKYGWILHIMEVE